LGKGLDALLPAPSGEIQPAGAMPEVPLDEIRPNPRQPRGPVDPGELKELAVSIRQHGVLQPLIVSRLEPGGGYLLIAGQRRLEAARLAGLTTVPVIIRQADERQHLELALIENLQRKDLTPFEEADGVAALAERLELTHEELARRIGKSRVTITELFTLRAIPNEIKALCAEKGVLSKSQLLQVARQPSEAKMRAVVRGFALGMLSREQAREERHPAKKPRHAVFRYVPPAKEFKLVLQFRKNAIDREEIIQALKRIIATLESEA
jgi:ParB family chromosome partitioning protein